MEAQDLVANKIFLTTLLAVNLNATKFEDISDINKIVRDEFAHFSASWDETKFTFKIKL